MGHIIDLPQRELAVDIKAGFKPRYQIIPGKKKTIDAIKSAASGADAVYLASDPDREGEAIAFHIANILGIIDTAHRVLFNEITKDAVIKGVEKPTKIDIDKVHAQQARRILDRLVGYKVSPILWKILHRGLSAGRVQSVALKILAKREEELEKFVPKEFWTIDQILSVKGKKFPAKVTQFQDKKLEISDEKSAKKHLDGVKKSAPFVVSQIERKKQRRNPMPPFVTSSMQLEASRKLGFSTKNTMRIAQQLYEGIELGDEGPSGLITYMRTDSVRIADVARNSAKKFIKAQFGSEYVGKIVHGTKKSAQDAHEAIRPTFPARTPSQIKPYLSKDQFRLYELIWRRFIASQMAPAQLDRVAVKMKGGEYLSETSETKILFDGFLKLWNVRVAQSEDEEKIKLPPLEKGDETSLENAKANQHFTKPPARYSEGTLVKELESQGIGRPSTYAQIISTLLTRKYVRSDKKRLVVTDLGKQVNSLLQKMFPKIFEEKFTAAMENKLDEVESGKKSWQRLLEEFYEPFSKKLQDAEKKRSEYKKETVEHLDRKCPECGAPLLIRWGRYGKFIACSNYPKCKYTEPLDKDEKKVKQAPIPLDEKCPDCGAQLVVKNNRWGGRFIACSNYPKCKYARPFALDIRCPRKDCSGKLLELVSKRYKKKFYACSEDNCDFRTFDEPLDEKCPECGAPTTFLKKTKKITKQYCAICEWSEEKGK